MEVSEHRGAVPPGPYLPWADEPRAWEDPRLIPSRLRRRLTGPTALTSIIEPIVARGRLARAVRMLTQHEVIVADRLHIALVCIMNGIPVVVVDNSYGKLSAAFRTWNLEDLAQARLVDTFDHALEVAHEWLPAPR
jgi:pyruvyl transferase EpsO